MKEDKRRDTRIRRRLTLSHDGRPFLDRWGLVHDRIGGFYLHHIAGPDPGKDMHDHPWAFVSVVLKGAYTEATGPAAPKPRTLRSWGWWGWGSRPIHRFPLSRCHRIIAVRPGTWTLVLRGPTRRKWGFYLPDRWVVWDEYDYETRRPVRVNGDLP